MKQPVHGLVVVEYCLLKAMVIFIEMNISAIDFHNKCYDYANKDLCRQLLMEYTKCADLCNRSDSLKQVEVARKCMSSAQTPKEYNDCLTSNQHKKDTLAYVLCSDKCKIQYIDKVEAAIKQ